jgi:antitoxin component HigA of HigAB toxin-antitoxin module
MAKGATITADEPIGPVADLLKTLPPLMDDPATYDSEEEIRDEDARTGDDIESTGDEDTDALIEQAVKKTAERDPETGKFKAKEKEAAAEETKAPETKVEEKPADPLAALMEQLGDDDKNAFEFARALRESDNPVEMIAKQAQQAGLADALLESLGIPKEVLEALHDPQQAAGIDPDYDPQGYELALKPHIDKLAKFPDAVRELAQPIAMEAVNQEISRMTPYIDASNIETQVLRREVQALKDILGAPLPNVDRKAIMTALQDPKATYDSAIDGVIGDTFKKSIEDYKQAMKTRPDTAGSESEGISLDDLPRDRKEFGIQRASDVYHTLFGGR